MKRKTKTIIRTVFLGITILNQIISSSGAIVECFSSPKLLLLYNVLSALGTAVASVFAWWFNNSLTKAAQQADAYLDSLKDAEENTEKCEEDMQ